MISIIVPVYNPGKRLSFLLDCIHNQSERDFEVLLIDDGSDDGSAGICDEFSKFDPRFRVFHQNNIGVSEARNRGLETASGSFVTFLDADDEIPVDYLEVLFETLRQTDADVAVCDVAIIKNDREINRFTHTPKELDVNSALNLLLSRTKINSGPCAKLFSRRVLRKIKFPRLKVYEDILFVRDVFANAQKIVVTNQTEYRYIQNVGSATDKNQKAPSLDVIKATDNLADFLRRRPELDSYCFYITISHMMQYALPLTKGQDRESLRFTMGARELLKKFKKDIVLCNAFPWKEKVLFMFYAYSGRFLCG